MAVTSAISDFVASIFELFKSVFTTAYNIVHSIFTAAFNFVSGIFNLVTDLLSGVFDVAGGIGKFVAGKSSHSQILLSGREANVEKGTSLSLHLSVRVCLPT